MNSEKNPQHHFVSSYSFSSNSCRILSADINLVEQGLTQNVEIIAP